MCRGRVGGTTAAGRLEDGEGGMQKAMAGVATASAGKPMRKAVEGEEEGPAVDGKEGEKMEKTAGAVSALIGERRMETGGTEVRKGAERRVQQVGDRGEGEGGAVDLETRKGKAKRAMDEEDYGFKKEAAVNGGGG